MQIEFYFDKSGTFQKHIYCKIDGVNWDHYEDLSPEQIELIFNHLLTFTKARIALLHLSKSMPGNKKEILQQFILCNWSSLDNKWDITDKQLNFEKVECPFKSNNKCPFQGYGIVCIKK